MSKTQMVDSEQRMCLQCERPISSKLPSSTVFCSGFCKKRNEAGIKNTIKKIDMQNEAGL